MSNPIFTSQLKLTSLALILIGVLGLSYAFWAKQELPIQSDLHVSVQEVRTIEHQEHLLHNRPWSAVYTALLFFFLLTLGVLVFYALQYVAQAGWSVLLLKVMEGITSFLLPASFILFIFFVLSVFHVNHIFHWMDEQVVDSDPLLQGKSSYLNSSFFLLRALFYLIGWNLYRLFTRRFSFKMDELYGEYNVFLFKRNFKLSAGFLVFFIVTESAMAWDWLMSLEPHWFSTLYGWYVFSSFFVAGIAVLILVTLYLKSKDALPKIQSSHLHSLGLYLFGFSIFWSYLWFCQFLLIWYANIPEETTYFAARMADYPLPFWGMLGLNLLFPLLLLMDKDAKSNPKILTVTAIVVLVGHYTDFFVMITPGLVGHQWSFGIPELSAVCLFLGLFLMIVLSALSKFSLVHRQHPLLEESKRYH